MKARICMIGNGVFANKVHYPSLHSFEDVEIVGICAFNEERLKQTALQFTIPEKSIYVTNSVSGYQKMLTDLRPDGVYVIGPPGQMLDCWIWCLKNKFNLFIEKPMGMTLHQAESLAYLAQQNACITQVSFQRRSTPLLQEIREACLKKGPITHAIVEFSKYDIHPMVGDRDRMLDDYIHAVDTARWICGGEIVEIESRCKRIMVPDINWIGASLYFDNGASSYVIGSWTSVRRVFRATMHAPGICGEVELEREAFLYADGKSEGVRYDSKEIAGSNEVYVYGGFQRKSREFINSVLSRKEETSSPFSDALKTMRVCETILAQALLDGV